MWTMWMVRFTYDRDTFTVYPYFDHTYPGGATALAYCRKVKGLHQPSTSNQKHKAMMTTWNDKYIKFSPDLKRFHYNATRVK